MKLEMKFKKSTKGTHVFEDTSKDSPIPTVYIKRAALPEIPPTRITISVEWQD